MHLQRFLAVFFVLMCLTRSAALAQNGAQAGDPPVASLITISPPDANGIITLSGASGAVFPGAQIAIRNLYTDDVVYTQGGITGTFNAQIEATPNTPFWISPAPAIPNALRNRPGSLPGGPGTIIYAPFPEIVSQNTMITQVVIDGNLSDWQAYPAAHLLPDAPIYSLANQDSLYLGFDAANIPADTLRLEVTFSLDGTQYALTLDPRLEEQTATLRRLEPNPADIGTLAVPVTQSEAVELRIPLEAFSQVLGAALDQAILQGVRFLGVENTELRSDLVGQPVPIVAESSGIVYQNALNDVDRIQFALAGRLAGETWQAAGRVNRLNFAPGDSLRLQLDVTMNVPDLPDSLTGLSMIGRLLLQPVIGSDGEQTAGGLYTNNGWSDVLTPSGLVIDNLSGEVVLGETVVPSQQVLRWVDEEQIVFGLDFALTIPETLPAGLYVPVLQGFAQVGDGERFRWEENSLLGPGETQVDWNRLPLVFNIGGIEVGRLVWTLFQDHPSNGSRGLLPVDANGALSNRVRLNSPTYILPPSANGEPLAYPLEPYLLTQMPNAYDISTAPLLPLMFPGGRLDVAVKKPDGTVVNFNSASIVQNQLSTAAEDESVLFGAQSQVDVYRLTTLNPELNAYTFDQYGLHEITLTGNIEDIWGNRYEGGGTYQVLIAELFDLLPGALPGTPYEVGDAFNPSLRLLPDAAADVTITVRVYPIDGGNVIEKTYSGSANRSGYFHGGGEPFVFDIPGEYVVEYEARYTDSQGRLWAGSLRSAGVIARPDRVLIAHGQRGLANYFPAQRPAWYNTLRYAPDDAEPVMQYPYFSGDVLWYADGGVVSPVVRVQDTSGAYTNWLLQSGYVSPDGTGVDVLAARDELPVVMLSEIPVNVDPDAVINDAYTYISAVRPGVAVRQYVQGSAYGGLPLYWDSNDPLNRQIGAGVAGERAGDVVFLFGGAVIRNAQAQINDTAAYAALGVVVDAENSPPRVFPPYRGQAGGPDGGALLILDEQPIEMFFHPTGVQPGQVLTVGDTLAIAGHVAPPLDSIVNVRITDPNNFAREFQGTANHVGYYYDPANDFSVGIPGVWTVEILVQHEGLTSAGLVQPPYPRGGVLGVGRFEIYVLPENTEALAWNETRQDFAIPASTPYNFNFNVPEGWTAVQVSHTIAIPGMILGAGPLPVSGNSFSYAYSPATLNRSFPNLEINTQQDGAAAADPVMLTVVVTGFNSLGQADIRSRTFYIFHDRLLTLE